jgi:hypothetical protein
MGPRVPQNGQGYSTSRLKGALVKRRVAEAFAPGCGAVRLWIPILIVLTLELADAAAAAEDDIGRLGVLGTDKRLARERLS